MNSIKIIKRKITGGEQTESPAAVQKQTSKPIKLQREMTAAITGWVDDWRGRKQTDARAAFADLFRLTAD